MPGYVRKADSEFDADGYQYGVRFSDGGVAAYWNGHTQREQAERYMAAILEEYGDHPRFDRSRYALVRHRRGEPWEVVESPVLEGNPGTNSTDLTM